MQRLIITMEEQELEIKVRWFHYVGILILFFTLLYSINVSMNGPDFLNVWVDSDSTEQVIKFPTTSINGILQTYPLHGDTFSVTVDTSFGNFKIPANTDSVYSWEK